MIAWNGAVAPLLICFVREREGGAAVLHQLRKKEEAPYRRPTMWTSVVRELEGPLLVAVEEVLPD